MRLLKKESAGKACLYVRTVPATPYSIVQLQSYTKASPKGCSCTVCTVHTWTARVYHVPGQSLFDLASQLTLRRSAQLIPVAKHSTFTFIGLKTWFDKLCCVELEGFIMNDLTRRENKRNFFHASFMLPQEISSFNLTLCGCRLDPSDMYTLLHM